ncbi:MAG: hypothetical protein RIT27_827 [Pseudomonadota bacterium]|jgi:hypothetical protein
MIKKIFFIFIMAIAATPSFADHAIYQNGLLHIPSIELKDTSGNSMCFSVYLQQLPNDTTFVLGLSAAQLLTQCATQNTYRAGIASLPLVELKDDAGQSVCYNVEIEQRPDSTTLSFGLKSAQSVSCSSSPTILSGNFKLLAANDLGMHCMDREYSIFSILPPYNVVNAQVVQQGNPPKLLDAAAVEVRYNGALDSTKSVNSSSVNKTDFWKYANALFGVNLQTGQGLKGLFMPSDNPLKSGGQVIPFNNINGLFSAEGIPITPIDDTGRVNPYPLMRISAHDTSSGTLLTSTDIVVPVAQETDCQNCHATGKMAASSTAISWSTDPNIEVQAKKNILTLHDKNKGTQLSSSTPVLCASCHYSAALDLAGTGAQGIQIGKPTMSKAMHNKHAFTDDGSRNVEQTCYQCHPGKTTQCQRGAMRNGGMQCFECHGGMTAVAGNSPLLSGGSIDGKNDGQSRRPWQDTPRCQSCHTGDALNHLSGTDLVFNSDGFRLKQAYRVNDTSASPISSPTSRFAENSSTLYRHSKGHGNVACEGCHGSTHAEFPNADPNANDNVASQQLQGHTGVISECKTCHTSLALTTNGPHGMHNVGDQNWANGGHQNFYRQNPDNCRACHGKTLDGSPLSKVAQTRSFNVEGRNVTFNKGDQVACNRCHSKP